MLPLRTPLRSPCRIGRGHEVCFAGRQACWTARRGTGGDGVLALLTVAFGLLGRARPGRMRALRLLYFGLIWLAAETASLLACLGLWVASGVSTARPPLRLRCPPALAPLSPDALP